MMLDAVAKENSERQRGAAAAGGAPGAAVLRLDKRTHLNGIGYRGSFIHYGDGLAEVSFGFAGTVFENTTPRGLPPPLPRRHRRG